MHLLEGFLRSASEFAERIAVEEPGSLAISYAELDELSDRLRDRLHAAGVAPGDRVGVCIPKSIDSVAAILGILKLGAAYVPTDPTAPAQRNGFIFSDCSVRAIVAEKALAEALATELVGEPGMVLLDSVGGGLGLRAALAGFPGPSVETASPSPDDLAYILYTSGSTGRPKGVMLSHRNARRFVDWCGATFHPVPEDRFSSHAPFHFDLSILDLYTPLSHGARLVLIPEELGKDPQQLAAYISDRRISVWYSTPSILNLLTEYGALDERDYRSLRLVLFAGEVFPIGHLKRLRSIWSWPSYYNLYGPTETNVCTYLKLPPHPDEGQTEPYPIGIVCEHYESRIVDREGVATTTGELLIAGDGVMRGYWNLDEMSAAAFSEHDGKRWYHTGDIVESRDDVLVYAGRKDRMVKKRGYRIELDEIEACLYRHDRIREAAVIAIQDQEAGMQIHAHLSSKDCSKISIIQLKAFCAQQLPTYMIPDRFTFHDALPKTSTDKTDYQALLRGA